MKKLEIKKYCEVFAVKKVKILNELKDKKSIFYLPSDFVCYIDDENDAVSFEKFEAIFDVVLEQEVFSVCIDDFLFIGEDFKLTDKKENKALFGKTAKSKKGDIEYSSIHARVAAVYTAVCEGKIKLGDILKSSFTEGEFYQCQACDYIGENTEFEDTEHDGDIHGVCPKCEQLRILYPCDKNGDFKED